MKLIRGSASISGIRLKRKISKNSNIEIIRPIISLNRNEIEDYCLIRDLKPRIDLSNFDNVYTRNRVRSKILPLILEENPNFFEVIQYNNECNSDEDDFLEELSHKSFIDSLLKTEENKIILSDKKFQNHHPALQRRIIKIVYQEIRKDKKSFSFKNIEDIRNCISKNISGKKNYSFG